jgi:4-diphosphocytidyl-2-C-methyl-D-erythritol kinase
MTRELSLRAPAKVNLDLRVLYKRADGFHELRTVFQTISLEDSIDVRYRPAGDVQISIAGNIEIQDNIVTRAARVALAELVAGGELDFVLDKRIPMGAGLGGGSSDAAAVLCAIPELVGRQIPPRRLHALAAQLGSDVPFFLYKGTAVGLGRGEEVYPLPPPPAMHGLLIAPEIHVSTAEAYKALGPFVAHADPRVKLDEFSRVLWGDWREQPKNDFEEPVFALHPELAVIREELESCGAKIARMTGSGSAIFGLFDDPGKVAQAELRFAERRTFRFEFVNR